MTETNAKGKRLGEEAKFEDENGRHCETDEQSVILKENYVI